MKKMKLVMVGNGMAGVRTLEELLKIAPDLYDITVFGAEPHPNYNRILLSPVLAGEQTLDEIVLNPLRLVRGATASRCTSARRWSTIDRVARIVRRRRRHRGSRTTACCSRTGSNAVHPAGAGQGPAGRDRLPRHRRHQRDDRGRDDATSTRSSSAAACSGSKRPTA